LANSSGCANVEKLSGSGVEPLTRGSVQDPVTHRVAPNSDAGSVSVYIGYYCDRKDRNSGQWGLTIEPAD